MRKWEHIRPEVKKPSRNKKKYKPSSIYTYTYMCRGACVHTKGWCCSFIDLTCHPEPLSTQTHDDHRVQTCQAGDFDSQKLQSDCGIVPIDRKEAEDFH